MEGPRFKKFENVIDLESAREELRAEQERLEGNVASLENLDDPTTNERAALLLDLRDRWYEAVSASNAAFLNAFTNVGMPAALVAAAFPILHQYVTGEHGGDMLAFLLEYYNVEGLQSGEIAERIHQMSEEDRRTSAVVAGIGNLGIGGAAAIGLGGINKLKKWIEEKLAFRDLIKAGQ